MDRATRVASVLEAARGLELLTEDGDLMSLDSLNVLDMVVELERLTGIEIPTSMPGCGGQGTGAESVDTLLAGFAAAGAESVDTSLAGFGTGRRPHPPGGRTAIPAAFR